MFAKGKIPYHIKLREATIRDIKLTPEQKNLVSIRNKFDEIRKHESELNGWISKIKKSNSPERVSLFGNNKWISAGRRITLCFEALQLREISYVKIPSKGERVLGKHQI